MKSSGSEAWILHMLSPALLQWDSQLLRLSSWHTTASAWVLLDPEEGMGCSAGVCGGQEWNSRAKWSLPILTVSQLIEIEAFWVSMWVVPSRWCSNTASTFVKLHLHLTKSWTHLGRSKLWPDWFETPLVKLTHLEQFETVIIGWGGRQVLLH